MDTLLYLFARAFILPLQWLPLSMVVRLGRVGGSIAWLLDRRHRMVAIDNLTRCFGKEMSSEEIQDIAKENFRRLGENYASAIKTASMSPGAIRKILSMTGAENIPAPSSTPGGNLIVAIGHFGNFELYARTSLFVPGYQSATTYRALRQPALNRLMQSLRRRSGALYFERRSEARTMKEALHQGGVMLGFLADQHAGDRGAWLPFFGVECSTSTAPAVFALRYNCPLHTAICHRTAPGRWEIEIGRAIPTHHDGARRSVDEITLEMNQTYEQAVRRDPANWFWVHRRWKPASRLQKADQSRTPDTDPATPSA